MRVELGPITPFRHDLGHCLHTTAGTLLNIHGIDPIVALGAAWWFRYDGDLRREEYYLPGYADDLFAGLAPFHQITSRWCTADDPDSGWRQVRELLADGTAVAVAADNFHLPFRPAYRDVHTNHLMLLYGFDDDAEEVFVVDPVPPSFQGPIPLAALASARSSGNPVHHDRDMFFTANPIRNRWLHVEVGAPRPVLDHDFVRHVIATNVAGFTADSPTQGLRGLAGFLDGSIDRLTSDAALVDEAFVVAGPLLAITGLHAEFLDRAGTALDDVRLRELSRRVDRVAHHWSAARIAFATARADRAAAVAGLRRRAALLVEDVHRVVEAMGELAVR